MNGVMSLCLVALLLVGGCGRKEHKADKKMQTQAAAQGVGSDVTMAGNEDLAFDDDDEFFDATSAYAFLEDDEARELTDEDLEEVEQALASLEEEGEISWSEEGDEFYGFKSLNFAINSSEIDADQAEALEEDLALAKSAVEAGKTVVVQGHCCELGPEGFNDTLALKRAESIKSELVKAGVPADKIETVGCSNEMPLVWSEKAEKADRVNELSPNRRAEILVN